MQQIAINKAVGGRTGLCSRSRTMRRALGAQLVKLISAGEKRRRPVICNYHQLQVLKPNCHWVWVQVVRHRPRLGLFATQFHWYGVIISAYLNIEWQTLKSSDKSIECSCIFMNEIMPIIFVNASVAMRQPQTLLCKEPGPGSRPDATERHWRNNTVPTFTIITAIV